MIKIILILALLQYIYNFIFGYKSNILSCGIFGNAVKNASNLDVNATNILGIYNIERGKNSCGITFDGEIFHGVDSEKLYSDFIKKREIKPKQFPILFGHTRQASFGNVINKENAHPFGFGTNNINGGFEFIGCHNGTLKNHKELAKKYNIDLSISESKTSGQHTYTTVRQKIDSEILLEILYKEKDYKVLSEYIGAAALVWTWCNEPNKIYLWSGASKLFVNENPTTTMYEERPLCVYTKSKNNIFFSSIKDSLMAIGGTEETVTQIGRNKVYIVTDGNIKEAEVINSSRKNAGQDENWVKPKNNFAHGYGQDYYDEFEDVPPQRSLISRHDYGRSNAVDAYNKQNSIYVNIFEETPLKPIADYKSKIYVNRLRYNRNGHVINGIYIYVKGWGFKLLSEDYERAINIVDTLKGLKFENGEFDTKNMIETSFISFPKDTKFIQFYYFIDGVLLKDYQDYCICQRMKKDLKSGSLYLPHDKLSHMSQHPIITMSETGDKNKQEILLNGQPYSGNFTELGFEKIYHVSKGNLIKIEKRKDIVESVIQLPINLTKKEEPFNEQILNESKERILELEEELYQVSDINNGDLSEKELDDFIDELVQEEFTELLEKSKLIKETLNDYKDNFTVKEALRTINLITQTLDHFIDNPNNN